MFADVTSANVVGYNNNVATASGTTYQGPVFVALGDGKLGDLKVTGYKGFVASEMVTISKITDTGAARDGIVWIDYSDMGLYGWYKTDWMTKFEDCNDLPLTAGESLKVQFQSGAVGWALQNAGEVALEGVPVKLVSGTQYLAAAVPRASTLGEIVVSGYPGGIVASEMVTISTITDTGAARDGIVWIDYSDMGLYGWYKTDWMTKFEDCSNIPLTVGQGLKVQAQSGAAGWTLTFPPAIPEDK